MKEIMNVLMVVGVLFAICYANQMVYLLISVFKKDDQPIFKDKRLKAIDEKNHKIGVLICARNESGVIEHLIQDVKDQDYPKEQYDIFVIADNCTDDTAQVARQAGAVVYERQNKEKVGKGYALDALYQKINADYCHEHDAFIVFDADNLVDSQFIREMNKKLCDGYEVVTSYRNSKNFTDSWISAGYSYWYLHDSQQLNRSRTKLGLSAAVSGTGFMFTRRLLESYGGWKFYTLTEDIEFTVYSVLNDVPIGYCEKAVFYDEQPVTFKESFKQRKRWAKGGIQVYTKYLGKLLRKVFVDGDLSALDLSLSVAPAFALGIVTAVCYIGLIINLGMTGEGLPFLLQSLVGMLMGTLFGMGSMALAAYYTEAQRIYGERSKLIFHIVTFPFYMMTWLPIAITAMFSHVEWEEIKHQRKISSKHLKA